MIYKRIHIYVDIWIYVKLYKIWRLLSSVTQSCPTICNYMDCSMSGFPVNHQLQEFAQTHFYQVGDTIQPSHPLSSLLLLPSVFPRVFSNKSVLHIRWPKCWSFSIISVQFNCSVVSDSLRPYGLQHARPPCPLPTPRAYSNSCSLSRWWNPNISSCHALLLLTLIFPNIRVFSNESVLCIRWPKYWSFSFSISPSNEYSELISF